MDPKRKKFQDQWIDFIKEMGASANQIKMYQNRFAELSDDQFRKVVTELRANNETFPLLTFNMDTSDDNITHEKVMEIGEKYGIVWHEKLVLTDPITGDTNITPNEYLIIEGSSRRLTQHVYKKRSTSENEYTVDRMSGQVTGDSKSSTMSKTELGIMAAKNLEKSALEAIKARGGDQDAWRNMIEQISLSGEVSIDPILDGDSRPTSLDTMNALLAGMMLRSTL